MAVNVEKIQAEVIEDFSRKAADVSLPDELVDLVREVTSDAVFISFPLLLSAPVFKKLVDIKYASSLDLLRLFAYGTWQDYKGNVASFPTLSEQQVWKLKQLTLLTLARSCKVLTYARLKKLLDFLKGEDLENFLESCHSLGIVKGNLNKQQNCFEVLYAVDSLGKSRGKVVGKSFDIFLYEARSDFTGTNGIVEKLTLPISDGSDCSMTELRPMPGSLFSSLVQDMTDTHAIGKSYDGLIYAAMFAVAGDRLRCRPEAAPWKKLTPERFSKDRKAVASILRENTGFRVSHKDRYGIKRQVLYPIYMPDLLDHLEGNITNLNKGHSDHPMSMARDKSYSIFLICHPTFLGYARRSVVFWYVRTYNKSSSTIDQKAFRNAMRQIKIKRADWHHALQYHWLFRDDFQLAKYKNTPEDCFRLIRDWEMHVQRSLSEHQKILYTAAIINYLVAYHFDDFLPQATYHMLCTYSKVDNKFDLINWIQRLRRLSEEDTATLMMEWDQLSFHGFTDNNVLQHQIDRIVRDLEKLRQNPIDGPSDPSSLAKWRLLNILRGKNETMYYKVLIENIEEYARIVYASTVRVLCQKSSGLFRSSSGLYLSAKDKGHMMSLFQNSSAIEVDMVVVTDGRSVFGFDDLGVNGIGIAIGKLDLYVTAGGINPCRVLPVMIDVGTDNEKLHKDPLYRGIHAPRLDEHNFDVIVHELVAAVSARWPKAILQFEGFGSKLSLKLLEQYKTMYRVFNDDIQGTTGVMIAGLLGVLKAQGRSLSGFPQLQIVVAGLDSAGIAILDSLRFMARMSGNCTASLDSYMSQLWIVDAHGLLTEDRKDVDADARPFARKKSELLQDLCEGACIADVVKKVKPDIVLILSAVPSPSSQEVLEAAKDLFLSRPASRPAIFAMPNSRCTAKDAFTTLGENIIFACGDQFPNVDLGNGKIGYSNHVNNMYLFPGIALGTLLSGASHVSDDMMIAAARCLASLVKEEDIINGILYPPVSSIRDISKEVASAVLAEAAAKGLANGHGEKDPLALAKLSKEDIMSYVESNMWRPSLCTT